VIADDEEEGTLVDKSLLIEIIAARAEEILEIVRDKMIGNGISNYSSYRAVLTGGSCQLNNTEQLVAAILGNNKIRTARPRLLQGLAPALPRVIICNRCGLNAPCSRK
jgi:cell division protein FtsA